MQFAAGRRVGNRPRAVERSHRELVPVQVDRDAFRYRAIDSAPVDVAGERRICRFDGERLPLNDSSKRGVQRNRAAAHENARAVTRKRIVQPYARRIPAVPVRGRIEVDAVAFSGPRRRHGNRRRRDHNGLAVSRKRERVERIGRGKVRKHVALACRQRERADRERIGRSALIVM